MGASVHVPRSPNTVDGSCHGSCGGREAEEKRERKRVRETIVKEGVLVAACVVVFRNLGCEPRTRKYGMAGLERRWREGVER